MPLLFMQVVRLCREHGLYGALIYLFNRGLDDYKTPLEELLVVVQDTSRGDAASVGYILLLPGQNFPEPYKFHLFDFSLLCFLVWSQN